MRTTRAAAALLAAAAITLTGCSSAKDDPAEPDAKEIVAEENGDTTTDETSDGGDGQDLAVPEGALLPDQDLPDVPAATGPAATNEVITVNIPEVFTAGEPYEGVQFFDGDVIPESVRETADGNEASVAGVQIYPAEDWEWAGEFYPHPDEKMNQAVYRLDVPGADMAAVEWVWLEEGYTEDVEGFGEMWVGATGTGTIHVRVGDKTTRVVVHTSPGQTGLEQVAAIAKSIKVN